MCRRRGATSFAGARLGKARGIPTNEPPPSPRQTVTITRLSYNVAQNPAIASI